MTPALISERLLMRPFEHEDATDLAALLGNEEVARSVCSVPLPFTPLHASARIMMLRATENQGLAMGWLCENNAGDVIGMVTVEKMPGAVWRMGFAVHPQHRGHGFGKEAIGAVVEWMDQQHMVGRLEVSVFADATPAVGVLLGLGFRETGSHARFSMARGMIDDAVTLTYQLSASGAQDDLGSGVTPQRLSLLV